MLQESVTYHVFIIHLYRCSSSLWVEIIDNTMTTAVHDDKYRSAGIETCKSYLQVVAYLWEARREFGISMKIIEHLRLTQSLREAVLSLII